MEWKEQWMIESNHVGSEREKENLNKILKKEYIRVRENEREGEKGRERKKARHLEMDKSIEEGTELFYRN